MNLPVTPYKIRKAFRYWKHFGTKEFINHALERMEPEEVPYGPWFEKHRVTDTELRRQAKSQSENAPWISIIVPAYHTPEKYFMQMADSVRDQSYRNWELVIADAGAAEPPKNAKGRTVREMAESLAKEDPRVTYTALQANGGIAANTNAGILASHGEYIGFLDHDDVLEPDALYEIAERISGNGADMIYTDEDKVSADLKKFFQPHFKPEFNPDLLRSNNYITHFLVVKRTLADEAGYFDPELDGAQDHDFILRCSEKAEKIARVPRILYHWRTHSDSTADNPMSKLYAYEAGKKAVEGSLSRTGEEGTVELLPDYGFYRVHYALRGTPKVSVIIPNKDESEALRQCVDSLLDTGYPELEIIIVENGSSERLTFEYYREISENPKIHLIRWKKGFNYSAINNYGVRFATGDYLLFLNNDVRGTISTGWLTELISVCQRESVGAVGAKLYYPDNRVQHAGVVLGIGGIAANLFTDLPKGRGGYMHKASVMQDLSAVTAACMMVKREAYEMAGGFTEELAVAFNDVDFCLKVGQAGYRIVYDPYAELYHDESRTRGAEDTPDKIRRFQGEIEYFRSQWENVLKEGDPNYNPNLSLKKWNYSLRV